MRISDSSDDKRHYVCQQQLAINCHSSDSIRKNMVEFLFISVKHLRFEQRKLSELDGG
jgi:hypothetical protein